MPKFRNSQNRLSANISGHYTIRGERGQIAAPGNGRTRRSGNCFHYNRIEDTRPSIPAKVAYLAFEVPANAYVNPDLVDTFLPPSLIGHGFIATPGSTVYSGDFVLIRNKTVEFRRDINAARNAARKLLPPNAVLDLAESTAAPGAHMPLCTP